MRLFYETNKLRFCYVIFNRGHLQGFLLSSINHFEEIEPVVMGVRL